MVGNGRGIGALGWIRIFTMHPKSRWCIDATRQPCYGVAPAPRANLGPGSCIGMPGAGIAQPPVPVRTAEISVVLCTYNPREDYLRRVVDGLRAQTLPQGQWEFIVVDNASNPPVGEASIFSDLPG